MRKHVLVASAVLATAAVATGCHARQEASLWSWFGPEAEIRVEHNEYVVDLTLREPMAKKAASKAILTALSTEDDRALSLGSPLGANLTPPLGNREFWAIVLARMLGGELHLYTYDATTVREGKISQLILARKSLVSCED